MKAQYAQAFLEVLQAGTPVDVALSGLKTALARKNHQKLLASVLFEAVRMLEASKDCSQAVVTTATADQAKVLRVQIDETLAKLGVDKSTNVKEVIDETLIGGFTATFNHQEHDQSYKKTLKSLYESITS